MEAQGLMTPYFVTEFFSQVSKQIDSLLIFDLVLTAGLAGKVPW
jgi:hypothetical protein